MTTPRQWRTIFSRLVLGNSERSILNYNVEEVYLTQGVPEFTFVRPPNYNELLVDMRTPGKPVILEGQSGTGKTTTARKILATSLNADTFKYLSARKSEDMAAILSVASGKATGAFIIDDFHRLDSQIQTQIADVIKIAAEEANQELFPKIVIIGINRVGSELIGLVHDVAKRCGIHRILPATKEMVNELVAQGESRLNVRLEAADFIYLESRGDYWLTQTLCQTICLANNVLETEHESRTLTFDPADIRSRMATRLESAYYNTVKEFARGKRFRPTNDPYFKLLRAISQQESSLVDLNDLARQDSEVRGSINNIKDERLSLLLNSKPICAQYFYYNAESKNFAIEDPALFYYLRNVNWERLRRDCGFRLDNGQYEFDIALSFAGENRDLARMIAQQLQDLDCNVFFDEVYEVNYLGKALRKQLTAIFADMSRFVVPLLDANHAEKIWPTFERETFAPRVLDEAVIPVFLDETVFAGIPVDILGISFKVPRGVLDANLVGDEITWKLYERLERVE